VFYLDFLIFRSQNRGLSRKLWASAQNPAGVYPLVDSLGVTSSARIAVRVKAADFTRPVLSALVALTPQSHCIRRIYHRISLR
jgi:hypothetical protein